MAPHLNIAAALRERMHAAQAQGAGCYILVDAALLPGLPKTIRELGAEAVAISPAVHQVGGADHALPWLIRLPMVETGGSRAQDRLLQASVRWALQSHAASWIVSGIPFHPLAATLSMRLNAVLPDNMLVTLRYADTRVFPVLLNVLTTEQRDAFLSIALAWYHLDRAGALHCMTPQADPATGRLPQMEHALHLDDKQQNQLLTASEPDTVIALLREHGASAIDEMSPADRHKYVLQRMAEARPWFIEATRDHALYCLVALTHGPDFAAQPHWQAALTRFKNDGGDLALLLAEAAGE